MAMRKDITNMNDSPIDLCRQFAPFKDSASALESRTWLEALAATGRTQGWEELLKTPFIAVLGEAGTGKTTEFKSTAERLRRNGQAAFFAPIVKLSKGGVESAVPLAEHDRLREWVDGDKEAVFFLDSVDEAELVQESLETALQNLAMALGENKGRVRVVVSCRVSDWHDDTGRRKLADFVRALGYDPEQDLKIVQMMPLAEQQVRRLAEARGAEDVDGLIDAIRAAAAEPFVERPLDVELLVPLWNRDGKLGSLTDLVERSVEFRLSERRPSTCPPSTLAPARANLGLERLAGIAVLSGRDSFLLSGQAPAGALGQDALDPQNILSDWSPAELRELLTRGVFDESTYGRVRIHHRSVQEYLAARWLLGMSESGLSRRDLDRLIVRKEGEREVVPAHLMPVAAWLAAWHAPTRDRLIGLSPDALLQHGDPGSLAIDVQERALGAYLQLYSGRERLLGRFDRVPLRRLAPALGDAVAEHLRGGGLPSEAQKLLLTLATEGRLAQCVERAAELALNEAAKSSVRCEAFRAVAVTGDEARRRSLASAALSLPGPWDRDVAGAFASGFFPTTISPYRETSPSRKVSDRAWAAPVR